MLRNAGMDDLSFIKHLIDSNRAVFGFVVRGAIIDSINKGEILIHDGGFVRFHTRRDAWVTVYEILINGESRRLGIGRELIEALKQQSTIGIRLKSVASDPITNAFYTAIGFTAKDILSGKRRALQVWEWRR